MILFPRWPVCLTTLLLILTGCSPKSPPPPPPPNNASAHPSPARYTIIPNDVAGIAEVTTRPPQGTNTEFVVHLQFTDAKAADFREFTRAHINQRVQLIIGHKIVAEPVIAAEVSNGQADLFFASAGEAGAIIAALGGPKAAASRAPSAGTANNP